MTTPYTLKKLTDVEDSAIKFGMGDIQEARFAGDDLEAEHTGLSLHSVKAGQRQPFAHKHDEAEEVYVVLAGSGRVKLDDEIVGIEKLVERLSDAAFLVEQLALAAIGRELPSYVSWIAGPALVAASLTATTGLSTS